MSEQFAASIHTIEMARIDTELGRVRSDLARLRVAHGDALVKINKLEQHNALLRERLR